MTVSNYNRILPNVRHCRNSGIALIVTLAVLVILTTIVYSLTARLMIYKRRQEFMINYQSARYACDSATKYALETVRDMEPETIIRSEMPDFSDLFYMTADQEKEMLTEWADYQSELIQQKLQEGLVDGAEDNPMNAVMATLMNSGVNSGMGQDPNNSFGTGAMFSGITVDPNEMKIPGPYGPPWPYVKEPVEFEIGNAKVTIKIRDENAKLPIVWTLIKDPKLTRATDEMFYIFCQWMQMDFESIDELKLGLEDIREKKSYTQNLKPIETVERITKQVSVNSRRSSSARGSRSSSNRKGRKSVTRIVAKKKTRPVSGHYSDYSRLMRSSFIDTEILTQKIPETGERNESPLKYIAMHGTQKVNINTAPRHVLIAAFTFGGQADEIAQAIIEQRKEKPYKDIADFKDRNYGFSDSIREVEPYITTQSRFFAIEITASCGNAVATSVTTIIKDGNKIEKTAMITN